MLPDESLKDQFPSRPPPSYGDISGFCNAARDGDVAGVTRYLDEFGAGIVNERDNINARAITWAAFNGHLEVVTLLLDRGAAIDGKGTAGKAALSWAAEFGRRDVAEALLTRGAAIDDRDDFGQTALDHARRTGNADIAKLIETRLEERQTRVEQKQEAEIRNLTQERLEKLHKVRPPKLTAVPGRRDPGKGDAARKPKAPGR